MRALVHANNRYNSTCIMFDNGTLRRRGNSPGETSAPSATHVSIGDDDGADDGKHRPGPGGTLRSSIFPTVLVIVLVCALLSSLISQKSSGSHTLKDLSDTIIDITRQLQNIGIGGEKDSTEIEELKRKLTEKEIELAWESQHVSDEKEQLKEVHDILLDQIRKEKTIIEGEEKMITELGMVHKQTERSLHKTQIENAKLKVDLAFAIEQLAKIRSEFPAAPDSPRARKRLGGGQYHPGDNVEIIEYEAGGRVSLRPGIVVEVNDDGTYNCVKLEKSITIPSLTQEQFKPYSIYPEGTEAWYQVKRDEWVPIKIVRMKPESYREGFELHGIYEFMYINDESSLKDDEQKKTVHEAYATLMHRIGSTDDISDVIDGASL